MIKNAMLATRNASKQNNVDAMRTINTLIQWI
jgi:hypothetical protein